MKKRQEISRKEVPRKGGTSSGGQWVSQTQVPPLIMCQKIEGRGTKPVGNNHLKVLKMEPLKEPVSWIQSTILHVKQAPPEALEKHVFFVGPLPLPILGKINAQTVWGFGYQVGKAEGTTPIW